MSSCSKYGGSSSGGSSMGAVEDSSVSPPATEGVAQQKRPRPRKANFSAEEVDVLLREVNSRRQVLFGPSNGGGGARSNLPGSARSEKLTAWSAVTACVNAVSKGELRTVGEIRKKWENMSRALRKGHQLGGEPNVEPVAVYVLSPDRFIEEQEEHSLLSQDQQFNFSTEESNEHGGYSSSEGELMIDIQPDVHMETFESPLIFGSESDEISSKTDVKNKSNILQWEESMLQFEEAGGSSTETTISGVPRQFCSDQLLQVQQQLLSAGEANSSTAVGRKQERQTKQSSSRNSSSSSENQEGGCEEQLTRSLDIEHQKLAVMKQLLVVETKRLKIEKKRLKIEKARLKLLLKMTKT